MNKEKVLLPPCMEVLKDLLKRAESIKGLTTTDKMALQMLYTFLKEKYH